MGTRDRSDGSRLEPAVKGFSRARPPGRATRFPRWKRSPPVALPGFADRTNYVYVGVFTNLNYPYVRSERPRRGGDYGVTLGVFHDASGTGHSFRRFEVEGAERFPVFGTDRLLTLHGRLSSSQAGAGHDVPFYLMDTLGGADNLRGFREEIIGGDETTSTLRSYDSFRFRDKATALFQAEFRQRLYAQLFVSVFVDAARLPRASAR